MSPLHRAGRHRHAGASGRQGKRCGSKQWRCWWRLASAARLSPSRRTGKRSTLRRGMAACGGPPRCLLLRPLSGEKRTSNGQGLMTLEEGDSSQIRSKTGLEQPDRKTASGEFICIWHGQPVYENGRVERFQTPDTDLSRTLGHVRKVPQGDVAPFHSITSSAQPSSMIGNVMPWP